MKIQGGMGENQREREMFYLTTHSTHFIYGYMASDIWLRAILIVRKKISVKVTSLSDSRFVLICQNVYIFTFIMLIYVKYRILF